jgi:hypothetical protein
MSLPSFPPLVLRTEKGAALTFEEADANLKAIRSYVEMLESILANSLNADGSLLDNTVDTNALKDRSVTRPKLAGDALPYYVDSGTANHFIIATTPALTEYKEGQAFLVLANNTNTGDAADLNVDTLGAKPLRKLGGLDLAADDIKKNSIFMAVYRAGAFEIVASSVTAESANSGGTSLLGFSVYTPDEVALTGLSTPYTFGAFIHGLDQSPTRTDVSLVCISADLGYVANDQVPIDQLVDVTGDEEAFAVQTNVTDIKVTALHAPYIRRLDAPIATVSAIDLNKWKLRVRAEVATSSVGTDALESIVNTFKSTDVGIITGDDPIIINEPHGLTFGSVSLTSDNTNVSAGNQVVIGTKTYTFAVTPSVEGDVKIGSDADGSLLNLIRAINHTGTSGTDYFCAAQNADVSADPTVSAHALTVTKRTAGLFGLTITTTSAHLTWGTPVTPVPKFVRCVIAYVNTVADPYNFKYDVGDEIDIGTLRTSATQPATVSFGAGPVNVWAVIQNATFYLPEKINGVYGTNVQATNTFYLRVYARL